MRDFLFPDLHLFKDPSNSTAIPGKGGRAPSHGGFRSRSGTINQTPPSPPPRFSISNLNNQRPRKERTKARAGPGGSARAGMRRGGGGGQRHRRARPRWKSVPPEPGGPAARPRTPPGTKFAGQPGLRRGGGGAYPARRAAPGPPGPLRGRPRSLPGLRERGRRGAAPSTTGPPRTPPRRRCGPR
ncbi:translation initiation factor IF-2-like [Pyrgilauda ruficollis]|uniref:translation initiation factor IF-2-like n=1 Tax=Pyrgilauda ruficollis TaxID=221976 RepID=UPI001B874CC5|nr:translation initiation factor IF-2-like [Pyrgilauda ruficollis]